MKKIIFSTVIYISAFLLCPVAINAQNIPNPNVKKVPATPVPLPNTSGISSVNFVRTWEPRMPASDTNFILSNLRTPSEVMQTTAYFDGLGRSMQTVVKGTSISGNDLVTPMVYDEFGREQFKYLNYVPTTGNISDGKYKANPFTGQQAFYQDATLNPGAVGESIYYSQTDFDNSPLNRVVTTYAPGNSWAKSGGNHSETKQYLVNALLDSVRIWQLQPATGALPTSSSMYQAGELFKDVTIDEAGKQVVIYRDKLNRTILKKRPNLAGSCQGPFRLVMYVLFV